MNPIDQIRKTIGHQMSAYFKMHGYTQKDVAQRMSISPQTVANHTHGAAIGKKTREAYFIHFGFSPEFLDTGRGSLVKKTSGYQKLKQENEQLKDIIKAQRAIINKLRKNRS